ncbi:MAG: hypothetical protein WBF51_07790 [Candidatus Dormiibacterota bacterium]
MASIYRYLRSGSGSRPQRVGWGILSCLAVGAVGWVLSLAFRAHGALWPWLVIGGLVGIATFLLAYPGLSELYRDRHGGWTASWEKHLSRPDGSTGVKYPDGRTEYRIQLRATSQAHGGASAELHPEEATDPENRAE